MKDGGAGAAQGVRQTRAGPQELQYPRWGNPTGPHHLRAGRGRDGEARGPTQRAILVPSRRDTRAPLYRPGPPLLSRADLRQSAGGQGTLWSGQGPWSDTQSHPAQHLRKSGPSLTSTGSSGPGQATTSLCPRTTMPASLRQLPGAHTQHPSVRQRTAWLSPSTGFPPPGLQQTRHHQKHLRREAERQGGTTLSTRAATLALR